MAANVGDPASSRAEPRRHAACKRDAVTNPLSALGQDVRQALRGLVKRPGVALAVFCTLALSIGANVTVFSIVNAVLLRPLPFGERSDRVVTLFSTHAQQSEDWSWGDSEVSYADLLDLREATAFEGLGGYLGRSLALSQDGAAERVRGGSVTPDLFPLLGVAPAIGRLFLEDEGAAPGLERVVLLTHGLWQRRYGARADIVGRAIQVNGLPRTVVGVLPPGFRFPERDDLYLPLRWIDAPRDARGINAVGLLRAGTSLAQAQQEASAIAARLARDHAATNRGFGVRLLPFRDSQVDRGARFLSTTLMAAVGFVLLIACANLTNLMLVQATGRQREMAVRSALGAGRGRLVRLVLVETALVAIAGTVAGLVAAEWLLDALRGTFPEDLPYWMVFDFDWRIALFAAGLTGVTTLSVGLLPALRASRPHLVADLKDAARATPPRGQQRLHAGLVVAQVAVCLALLVGASMVVRGFLTLQTSDLGFDDRPLLSMRVYLAGDQFDPPDTRARAIDEIAKALSTIVGVESAAATTSIPGDDGGAPVRVVADGAAGVDDGIGAQTIGVSAGIFDTLGLSLIDGRPLTAAETIDPAARVAVVNEALAARFWPDGGAVGRRVGVWRRAEVDWYRVVGVAPDVHYEEVSEETPQSRLSLYLPQAVTGARSMALLARATGDPDRLVEAARVLMRQRFPDQPVFELMSMAERRRFVSWEAQFMGEMMGTFAAVAVCLAGLGVYALLAYSVRRRVPEIGVRLALGARPGDVVGMFVRQGLTIAGTGVLVGVVLASLVASAVEGFVFGSNARDPRHFAVAAVVLGIAVVVACYLPARRASRVDPSVALRAE